MAFGTQAKCQYNISCFHPNDLGFDLIDLTGLGSDAKPNVSPGIVAKVERRMGLCNALEARLKTTQVERERLVEVVVQQLAFGAADNRT